MDEFEREVEAQARLDIHYIQIFDLTDEHIASAICKFRDRWKAYSSESTSHNIKSLVKELIDPAVSIFVKKLKPEQLLHCPVVIKNCSYSDLIDLGGFNYTAQQIKESLRRFLNDCEYSIDDKVFSATQDTLYSLFLDCNNKKPITSRLAPDIYFNSQRKRRDCAFCGNPTEFSFFINEWNTNFPIEIEHDDIECVGLKKRPDLSNIYCIIHRPLRHDGSWNPLYKQAKRSKTEFDKEVLRLQRQVAHPDKLCARTGDELIDLYFHHFMYKTLLDPTNIAEIRNIARRMVDSRLTDTKKKILVLRKAGFTTTQIGNLLGKHGQKSISNQAVSKSLSTIKAEFCLT